MRSSILIIVFLFFGTVPNSFSQSLNTTHLGSAFVSGRAFYVTISKLYDYAVSGHNGSPLNILHLQGNQITVLINLKLSTGNHEIESMSFHYIEEYISIKQLPVSSQN
jgi:hypothetical protein